jgi:hypothetical protein
MWFAFLRSGLLSLDVRPLDKLRRLQSRRSDSGNRMVSSWRGHSLGMRNDGHDQPGMIKLYAYQNIPRILGPFFLSDLRRKTEVHMGLGLGTW